jgi:ribosomal protein L28
MEMSKLSDLISCFRTEDSHPNTACTIPARPWWVGWPLLLVTALFILPIAGSPTATNPNEVIRVELAVAIAFSQLVIRTFVPIQVFRISHFIFWVLSEILAVSLIETFIFADYAKVFLHEFLISLRFISIGLVLPYAFSILVLTLLHQKRIMAGTIPGTPKGDVDLIHFRDEREQVKFSVRKSYILYLESSDNYVTVYYSPDGQIKKDMVRSSMKKMESQLAPKGLIRCHRSFMVNLQNVQWIKKKGRHYQIKMKNCDLVIPVSRGYHSSVRSLVLE